MNINDENDKNLLLNDEDNSLTENASSNDELISNNETNEQTLLNDSEDTLLNDDEMPNNTPEINEIAEANESLATLDSDPYNLIKDVNLTLSNIEKKIDKETEQLIRLTNFYSLVFHFLLHHLFCLVFHLPQLLQFPILFQFL